MTNCPPLQNVTVLDLTRLLPGPLCTMHLADLGADVIKIEDSGAGDYAEPAMRAAINRNKRGLRLDLKSEAGRDVFLRLAARADVIVEGFRPGIMERLGAGFEAVRAVNPRIVYCSITGYGQTGPFRDRAGHDVNYCGYAGVAEQNGTGDGSLALPNLPPADLMGGALNAAMGILAALLSVRAGGMGRHVDISMTDGILAHAVMPLIALNDHGATRPAGQDTLSGGLPCYGLYRTKDGRYLAVGALEPKFWRAFCDMLGREDLKAWHRGVAEAETARVRAEVAAAVAASSWEEWHGLLAGTDCCVSPVLTLEEALESDLVGAREMAIETDHPVYGALRLLACPVKMTGFAFEIREPAPTPGQHSDAILKEAGFTAEERAALAANGVI
jgi:crotonobetainyl-CoA:carnitine CoA-transferase CaiB-like acyl-CoA transferase